MADFAKYRYTNILRAFRVPAEVAFETALAHLQHPTTFGTSRRFAHIGN